MNLFGSISEYLNPSANADIKLPHDISTQVLPTFWLIGKTGAGKSSLVKAITESNDVEVGNGFMPCTTHSSIYEFPEEKPIMRFLDTRGFGEANYKPQEDIAECNQQAHLVLVLAKSNEPEQSDVINALQVIRDAQSIEHVLVIHTNVNGGESKRGAAYNHKQFENAWGDNLDGVEVDFLLKDQSGFAGQLKLLNKIAHTLPTLKLSLDENTHELAIAENFDTLKNEILWYASTSSASDLFPAIGLVTVPGIQAKMLHSIAAHYGYEFDKELAYELFGALGVSFGLKYGASLGVRQLAKLIPGYGQTAGAVVSAGISFGSTYALGLTACHYFYKKQHDLPISSEDLQRFYEGQLSQAKPTMSQEKS